MSMLSQLRPTARVSKSNKKLTAQSLSMHNYPNQTLPINASSSLKLAQHPEMRRRFVEIRVVPVKAYRKAYRNTVSRSTADSNAQKHAVRQCSTHTQSPAQSKVNKKLFVRRRCRRRQSKSTRPTRRPQGSVYPAYIFRVRQAQPR